MTYVRYIDKTREYYLSQGYEKPYNWAHFDDAPFMPLSKPLAESRVALVSTGEVEVKGLDLTEDENQMGNVGGVYSIPSDTLEDRLFSVSHSYDKHATTLDDVNAYFPSARLHEAVEEGRIAGLTERFIGVYNAYSQRRTIERDAPEVLKRLRQDGADVALMVPV
ncbi:MAG: glycine/sarcosine/betaine reductase selenoprotein B family protein [Pseudomonadota bacterium]|nr:glycine/sarcosine/betaine reductase selenoprotein B family protein [Pseudomonadota bacterium]|tara:strand:- start:246 stop:740 length:495 start_codon:yes stop_codon:yes gene_type:complete